MFVSAVRSVHNSHRCACCRCRCVRSSKRWPWSWRWTSLFRRNYKKKWRWRKGTKDKPAGADISHLNRTVQKCPESLQLHTSDLQSLHVFFHCSWRSARELQCSVRVTLNELSRLVSSMRMFNYIFLNWNDFFFINCFCEATFTPVWVKNNSPSLNNY